MLAAGEEPQLLKGSQRRERGWERGVKEAGRRERKGDTERDRERERI